MRLPERSQMLIVLATLITNQSFKQFEIAVEAAINLGLKAVEIKEVLYQSAPYVGFAKLFDFFDITNQVFEETYKLLTCLPLDVPQNNFDGWHYHGKHRREVLIFDHP